MTRKKLMQDRVVFEDVNLDDKCKQCKNLYSSQECEMCEEYDMFEIGRGGSNGE